MDRGWSVGCFQYTSFIGKDIAGIIICNGEQTNQTKRTNNPYSHSHHQRIVIIYIFSISDCVSYINTRSQKPSSNDKWNLVLYYLWFWNRFDLFNIVWWWKIYYTFIQSISTRINILIDREKFSWGYFELFKTSSFAYVPFNHPTI